jgi:transcriptional regulator with XRE-family HTH domain
MAHLLQPREKRPGPSTDIPSLQGILQKPEGVYDSLLLARELSTWVEATVYPRIDEEKLRGLQEGKFLSHRELATRAGVSPTTVLNLEAGKGEPQRRTIRKLAQALGVDTAELVEYPYILPSGSEDIQYHVFLVFREFTKYNNAWWYIPRTGGRMIGERVRRKREQIGLTGAQLAERAGMAPSAVSQIETGRRSPSATSVMKLAEALGVEAGDLFPKAAQPSLTEGGEFETALRTTRENFALLRAYFVDPPDEETADEAIEEFYELTPRLMEILAKAESPKTQNFGQMADVIRTFADINQRLAAWNMAEYGHLHQDAG